MPARRSNRLTRRTFLLAAAGGAALAAGGLFLERRRRAPRLPQLRLGTRSDLTAGDPYDVCVVGSGFAGAVLGRDLVAAGLRTLIVESGLARGQAVDPRVGDLEIYDVQGDAGYPLVTTRARAVGGTSHLWTGRCERLHASDFEPNAYTPPGAAWPIRYAEMEPYYDRADRTLQVRGGRVSAFSPPRRHGFPERLEWWRVAGLHRTLRRIDVLLDESPVSRGTPDDTTLRVHRDLLPAFTSSPHGRLVTTETASRLLVDASGAVTGLEVRNLDGGREVIRAKAFVVACGGVETPRLLLLSRSDRWPDGIGNSHGLVGRCFTEHPNLTFSGAVPGMVEWMPLEISRCHQFYESFKRDGFGSALFVFTRSREAPGRLRIGATLEMRPVETNRVSLSESRRDLFGDPAARLDFSFAPEDLRTLDHARELIRSLYRQLGGRDVSEWDLSWSHHHVGTCRMGDDPRSSVVDRNLLVHGTANLYLAGSAVFVTGGASHPTPLIVALAHRLAEHLTKRVRDLSA